MRLFAKFHFFSRDARPLRHRHGRRVGRGRVAGDGGGAYSAGAACCRAFCRAAIQWDICWRRWWRDSFCRRWAGDGCSGWEEFPRCWRFISACACRNRRPGSSIARPARARCLRIVAGEWKRFAYLVLLMVFMMFLSHGTQDLYPDFLRSAHGVAVATISYIAMLYNVGAIVGAIIFGELSERAGRRVAWSARWDCRCGDPVMGVWPLAPGSGGRGVSDAGGRAGRVGRDPRAFK